MSQPIVQQITLPATPDAVYRALMEGDQHAAFTGAPATIDATEGGAFACFGGMILGRNLDLQPGARIVQAWRVAAWPAGLYSVVRMDLEAEGAGTKLTLTHTGVPESNQDAIAQGWNLRYWQPLAGYKA